MPPNGNFSHKAVFKFQFQLLHKCVKQCQLDLKLLGTKHEGIRSGLHEVFGNLGASVLRIANVQARTCIHTSNDKLKKKLQALSEQQDKPFFKVKDSVKNLSNVSIPNDIWNFLSFGPKHPCVGRFNKIHFYKEVEKTIRNISDNQTITKVAAASINYANSHLHRRSNAMIKREKRWCNANNLLLIPFDKGNGYCVCTNEQYDERIRTIISGPQFKQYTHRPNTTQPVSVTVENKFNRELKRCLTIVDDTFIGPLRKNFMRKSNFNELCANGSKIPHMYGTAKVHKSGTPLRPIVSAPGAAYYNLAKYLASILSEIPEANINCNAKEVKHDLTQQNEGQLVSYDVVSLFTNVPLTLAIDHAVELLPKNACFDKDTAKELLRLCCANTIFGYKDELFIQVDGVAMGSPVAPLLANIYMSKLEASLSSAPVEIKYYKRYVDDTLVLLNSDEHADRLLQFLNSLCDKVKFTMEKSDNEGIPFLDLFIHRNITTSGFITRVYTKPTNTELLSNYNAVSPKKYKVMVIKSLIHRAHTHSSNWTIFHEETMRLKELLIKNAFPQHVVESTIKRYLNSHYDEHQNVNKDSSNTKMLLLQYRGLHSKIFANHMRRIVPDIKIVFTTVKSRTLFPLPKISKNIMDFSNIIYKFSCNVCKSTYIGRTKRIFFHRLKEHFKGELGKHTISCSKHNLDFKDFSQLFCIIDFANSFIDLCILESLHIINSVPKLNTQLKVANDYNLRVKW